MRRGGARLQPCPARSLDRGGSDGGTLLTATTEDGTDIAKWNRAVGPLDAMDVRNTVSRHLPTAILATVAILLVNLYFGTLTPMWSLVTEFVLHVVAIFVGFVVVDAAWDRAFGA